MDCWYKSKGQQNCWHKSKQKYQILIIDGQSSYFFIATHSHAQGEKPVSLQIVFDTAVKLFISFDSS